MLSSLWNFPLLPISWLMPTGSFVFKLILVNIYIYKYILLIYKSFGYVNVEKINFQKEKETFQKEKTNLQKEIDRLKKQNEGIQKQTKKLELEKQKNTLAEEIAVKISNLPAQDNAEKVMKY